MILTPSEFVGPILQLCQDKRGVQKKLEYLKVDRVLITYELPFNEVVMDFYDKLKTISRGYGSLDYHVTGYWESPLVKMDILVNGDPVDALSSIVHKDAAYERGRALVAKMRELIPGRCSRSRSRRRSAPASSPASRSRRCARTCCAKCYGGDISRSASCSRSRRKGRSA
jgi:GTP-binding protein LepA